MMTNDGFRINRPGTAIRPARTVAAAEILALFLGALLVLFAVQNRTGAWEREFGFHPDESAHYVTGVMVSEYIRDGAPTSPLRFAEQYYIRYPRLAIGHWPPLFPATLGGWFLLFGPGRGSVFTLMALLGAATATLLYLLVRRGASAWLAAGAVVWWILFQAPTQILTSSVMTEVPLTLCCLAAVLAYISYLERPGLGSALLFGLAAAAALLIKGLGIVLAFLPPLGVLACGRLSLLKRWDFWLPAGVVLLLAGPWYLLQGSLIPTAFGSPMHRLTLTRLVDSSERAGFVVNLLGPAATIVAALALAAVFLGPALRGRCSPMVAVIGAYAVASLFLHVALPESAEPRHLFHLTPVFIAVVALAAGALAERLPAWTAPPARFALALLALGRLAWPHDWPQKPDFALIDLAERLAADHSLDGSVFLVSSNGTAEGAFIAEAARLAPDPRWFVLRATKSLAWVNWRGGGYYEPYFETAESLEEYLESQPVAVLVLERGQFEDLAHDALLRGAIEEHPERWRRIAEASSSNQPFQVFAYRSTAPDVRPRGPIRVDMSRRLGHALEASPNPSLRELAQP
ncbi:MAG: hypothetical protein GC160_23015 [Acidobacteria bacterium]|nr:hypothetical protein [Acidobacteriota bacterium]